MQDIIIGSDHRGFELKQKIKDHLRSTKHFFVDVGCADTKSVDFPNIAKEVVECVQSAKHFAGILICGSGVGMSMAANRYKGIRAALCNSTEAARMTRSHNDANILCLGADGADDAAILKIINAFLNTRFSGEEKYKRRNELLDK